MKQLIRVVAGGLALLLASSPAAAEAGGFGRLLGHGGAKAPVTKAAAQHARPKPAAPSSTFQQDLKNHRNAPVHPLQKDRTVFRYTTKGQARDGQRKGLSPGAHMTARGGPGRPLTPEHAQSRYALPRKPDTRITVHLKDGQPVRSNKIAGAPDQRYREITSPARTPRSDVAGLTPLKPPKR
jgi:hypothetical protein